MPPRPQDELEFVEHIPIRDIEAVLQMRQRKESRKVFVEVGRSRIESVFPKLHSHLRRRVVHPRPTFPSNPSS